MLQLSYLWYTVKQNDTRTDMFTINNSGVLPPVYSQAEPYKNRHAHTHCLGCLISGIQSSRTIQEQTCSHSITRVSYLQYTVKQNHTRTDMLTLNSVGVLPPVYSQAEPYKNRHAHTHCIWCLISGIQSSRTIQEQTCSHSLPRVSYLRYTVKQNDTRTDMLTLTASGVLSPVYSQAEPYKNRHVHTHCLGCLIFGIQSSRTIQEQTCSHSLPRVSYLRYTVKQNDTRADMLTLTASGVLSPVYSQAEPYKDRHAHTHCLGCLISGIQSSRTIQEKTCSHSLPRVSYLRYTVKQSHTRTDMLTLTASGVLSPVYSQAERYKNRHAHTHCLGCPISDIQSSRTIQEQTCSHSLPRVSYRRYTVKQNDTRTDMHTLTASGVLSLEYSQAE
jgi:type III secretory pathway component EscS